MFKLVTRGPKKTQKFAARLAREFTRPGLIKRGARVIALEGNLGSGKTTFVQGFTRALGIEENVLSPTFVLMKIYKIGKLQRFKHLIHIDCYRIDSPKDLLRLGFKDLLKDKDAIILIEWADRIRQLLPRSAVWVGFKHGRKPNERVLKTNACELRTNERESRISRYS